MSSASSRLQRDTWSYYRELRGEYLMTNGHLGPNPYGAQCVNVPNSFWARMGLASVPGNAADWIGLSDDYREWVPATTRTRVFHGDVCVFRLEWVGPNGHVAVVLDGSKSMLASFDQNWPLGAPVSEVWHNRASVAGVVRMRGYYR